MSKVIMILPRDNFKALKGQDVDGIIRKNLPRVEETLKAKREEFLREKVEKLEEKLREMEGDIEELKEFYGKALKDRALMMAERDRLRRENAELRAKVEEKRKGENVHGS